MSMCDTPRPEGPDGLTDSRWTLDATRVRLPITVLAVLLVGCQAPAGESAIAQESVVVSPATFDFGTVQIGSTSAVHTVTVSPSLGNQSDVVTAVTASCPDFMINAPGLPADVYRVCEVVTCATPCPLVCMTTELQTYSFETSFRPKVAGTVSCVVTVTEFDNFSSGTTTKTITLTGTGEPAPIQIDVQPASVAFGDVQLGTDSTAAQVTVRSAGSSALTVSSVAVPAGFAIASGPTGSYQLAPNASQAYQIVCHPTAVGPLSGNLVVASDDPARSSVSVTLSCKGIDSNLDIAPSPAVLATTRVGEPVDATIRLSNTGTATTNLESVTLSTSAITLVTGPPAGTLLAPSASVDVGVHFDAAAPGVAGATLVATYGGGKSRTAEISARALATSMALTPDGDVDFGPVCAGASKTQDFTLIANDEGAFSLGSISDPGAPFSISAPALPINVLGAGATAVTFQVTAAPADAGAATAPMVVHTDIPGNADRTLTLRVQALPAGATATPDMIDLGSSPINTTTLGQEVHLSNCSPAAIAFANPRLEGADAAEFAIVQQPSSSTIAPSGLASWLIVLTAHTAGVKQASFAVDHDGGTASVPIQGEGLGDLGAGPGRGSYYACATGRPSALWPIGVALALLLRRRRR